MIATVKKLRIIFEQEEKSRLLLALQKNSIFMLANDDFTEQTTQEQKTIEEAITILETKSKLQNLDIAESDFLEDRKHIQLIASDVVNVNHKLIELTNLTKEVNEKIALIDPYNSLDVNVKGLKESNYLDVKFIKVPVKDLPNIIVGQPNEESPFLANLTQEVTYQNEKDAYLIIYGVKEDMSSLTKQHLPASVTFNEIPSFSNTVLEELEKLNKLIEKYDQETTEYAVQMSNIASNYLNDLKIYYDYLENQRIRQEIKLQNTQQYAYIEGYVAEEKLSYLKKLLSETLSIYNIEDAEILEDEIVPTYVKSKGIVKHFEMITNSFSVPKYKGVDPNPFVCFWYLIMFGIMTADVGYGLLMMVLFGGFLLIKKPIGTFKSFCHIFFYCGITTFIGGILLGGFFGWDFDLGSILHLPFSTILISPIKKPIEMLIVAMVVGVLHISNGLVIDMVASIKAHNTPKALAKDISWLLIFIGIGIWLVGQMVLKITAMTYVGFVFIGIGVLLILIFSGAGKGVTGHVISGLGGIYGATSFLSDILSYSRILALCLSGGQIAYAFTLLSSMVLGMPIPGLNFLLAAVVFLIGHTINFASGLLSSYIHTSRLQYLEFFGKFYEGDGVEFAPLKYKFKYIKQLSIIGGNQ